MTKKEIALETIRALRDDSSLEDRRAYWVYGRGTKRSRSTRQRANVFLTYEV